MAVKDTVLASFLLVCAGLLTSVKLGEASAQKLALHATQAEVNIWRQRTVSGPYKDGWTIIKSRADAFVSNPGSRWAGKTNNTCYTQRGDGEISRTLDRELRDAGLAYLITGNTSYRNALRTALLDQAALPGTDFTNSNRWCVSTSDSTGVANWIRRLVYGYSYIRDSVSMTERTTLDSWFLGAGRFFEGCIHNRIKGRFPNRLKDDYSACVSSSQCPGESNGVLYFGGPKVYEFNQSWANQPAARNAMIAAVGVVVNDAGLKDRAKRFVHEWLKYSVWANGEVFDQHRWNTSPVNPQVGYSYAGTGIGSIISIADHLARSGDTSLYQYSTSEGMYGSQGGPKSILRVLQHFAALTNGTTIQYASNNTTSSSELRIAPFAPRDKRILFNVMAPANIFYKDNNIKKAYTTPFPSSWKCGGYDCLGGDWGAYPHVLFMFGQQENAVWPYSPETTGSSPSAVPASLPTVNLETNN